MPGEKLIDLLKTFNKREKEQLASFLKFNAPGKKKIHELYEQLRNPTGRLDDFSSSDFSKLKKEISHFLAFQGLKQFTGLSEALSIREEHKRSNHWNNLLERDAKKALDKKGISPETIFVRKLISYEKAYFLAANKERGKHFELGIADLKLQLSRYFSLQMVVHLCEETMVRLVKGKTEEKEQSSDFEQHVFSIMEKTAEQWPLLSFYLETLEGLRTGSLMPLAVERFKTFEMEVSEEDRQFLWSLVFAQHSAALNQGNAEVTEQVHDFLIFCIEKGYANGKEGKIRESILKNLLETKVRLGRTKEAWELLIRYKKEVRPGMYYLASATIYFAENDFQSSLKHLYKVQVEPNLKDIFFGFGVDFLMAKNHYELGELEEVERIIANLKDRLNNNKYAGKYHEDTLRSRMNIFRRLVNARQGKGLQIDRLVEELETTRVDDREWLLAKAKAMRDAP